MRQFKLKVDVLVIGAGPAGAVAAAQVASAGAVVALFDRQRVKEHEVGESLPPVGAQLLRSLDVSAGFDPAKHMISNGVRAAWGGPVEERPFMASPYGHGWLLDRPAFDIGLRDFAVRCGAVLLEGLRVGNVVRRRSNYVVDVATESDSTMVVADWIIDCSGRSAIFSVGQGAKRIKHDRLVAIWRMYQSLGEETDKDAWTMIESGINGWFYTAAIPNRRRVVVFLTDSDLPACRIALRSAKWSQILSEACLIRAILCRHKYELVGRVRGVAASSTRLEQPFGFHWVAAGDAAVAFDPISSRGIAAAMTSGANASGAVLEEHAGRSGAFAAYAEDIAKNYKQYLSELNLRYRLRGNGEAEFWARRSGLSVRELRARAQ
jgi:flavin-dependent dehydrogenase